MLSQKLARHVDRRCFARRRGRYWGVRLCAKSLRPQLGYKTWIRFFRTFRSAENARRKLVTLRGSLQRRNMTVFDWSVFRLWSRWRVRYDAHGHYGFEDDVHMTGLWRQGVTYMEVKVERDSSDSETSVSSPTSDSPPSRASLAAEMCEADSRDE